jgi:thioredoxin-dependent peroxiredoxin
MPLTLVGANLNVGDAMPDVTLMNEKFEAIHIASLKGKVIVLSVVPGVDAPVCEVQTHKVSDSIATMPPGVEVFTVSRDQPYTQKRFVEEAHTMTKMASDSAGHDFGRAFGVEVKETGVLARSVWVVGADGKIAYREIVPDQKSEPNYDALMAAVKAAAGG